MKNVEIENQKKKVAIGDLRLTYLQEKIDVIAKEAKFSPQDLASCLTEVKKQEDEIKLKLDQAQANLQQAEQQWWEAKQQAEQRAANRTVVPEQLAACQQIQDGYKQELTRLTERLRDCVQIRSVWNDRFRILNHTAPAAELPAWREHWQESIERFSRNREALDLRLEEARLDLAAHEKRLRAAKDQQAPTVPWIERQVQAEQRLIRGIAEQLMWTEATQRLLKRTLADLDAQLSPTSALAWLTTGWEVVKDCWQYEITSIDDQPITVGKILVGVTLILAGYILARRLSRLLGTRVLPRFGLNAGAASALQTVAFYLLLAGFGFFTLELLHIPVTIFTFLGGAIAIGVGFGSQNILNNFISGLILLAERPIRVGDVVQIDGGLVGSVEEIGARSTRIKTGSNMEILVPNSKFLETNVTNWTLSDTWIRTSVTVGVAYGSPTREVARLLRQAVDANPQVLRNPEPAVLFQSFGDNTLNFEVFFWICLRSSSRANVESDVRFGIDDLLRDANITIAFPQRDIHLDTMRPLEIKLHGMDQALSDRPPQIQRVAA